MEDFDFILDEDFDIKKRSELIESTIDYLFKDIDLASPKKIDEGKKQTGELLSKLDEEEIEFGNIDLITLTEDELRLSDLHESQIVGYNFYRVEIPLTLWASSGYAFTRLFCEIEFDFDVKKPNNPVIIYDLFPRNIRQTVAEFETGLKFGLSPNFTFRSIIAGVTSRFIAGPFNYKVYRNNIQAAIFKKKCKWRLEGQEHIEKEDLKLIISFKVSENRKRPLNMKGRAEAHHEFNHFGADIRDEIFRLPKNKRTFFSDNYSALPGSETWKDILQLL